MFKKLKKNQSKIDQSQLSEEEKKKVGLHINKPLLIVSITLFLAIIVLVIVLKTILK